MKNVNHFKVLSIFFVLAFLLAACGGALPQDKALLKGPRAEANTIVAFKGVVQTINSTEWTINGQKITLDPQALLDPNIAVGDEVNVEANVAADGVVVATKVESARVDDMVPTPAGGMELRSTPDPLETPAPDATSAPEANNSSDNSSAKEKEVSGTVEAMTADTITVDGVTYDLMNFTELKDTVTAGDTVKLHVTVNPDGTVTVREIEKSTASLEDNSGNSGGVDDGSNHDVNDGKSGGNGNSSNDSSTHNSNDKHGGNGGSGKNGSGG